MKAVPEKLRDAMVSEDAMTLWRDVRRLAAATCGAFTILVFVLVPTNVVNQLSENSGTDANASKKATIVNTYTGAVPRLMVGANEIGQFAINPIVSQGGARPERVNQIEAVTLLSSSSGGVSSEHQNLGDYTIQAHSEIVIEAASIYDSGSLEQDAEAVESEDMGHNDQEVQEVEDRPSGVSTGFYIWPADGTVTSRFGPRRASVGSSNHKGIDISGRSGDPLLAADGGEVIFSGWSDTFGNMVRIMHDNGHVTLYAHCSSLLVRTGDIVTQGQRIARMGMTGISSGVHLHFELIVNGVNINPLPHLTVPTVEEVFAPYADS